MRPRTAEALRLLDRYTPDLILLDLVLPWVNGLEVLATLLENPAFRQLPVLVITGTLATDRDLQAFQPVKVMRKPMNFDRTVLIPIPHSDVLLLPEGG